MTFEYPALIDYIKDESALIATVSKIFESIRTLTGTIFQDYDAELFEELGQQYYFEKRERPLNALYIQKCDDVDWSVVADAEYLFTHVGKVACSRFGDNWKRIYAAYFSADYNPIENYDMTQTRTPNLNTNTTAKRKQETVVNTSGSTSIVPFNETESTLTGESSGDSVTTEDNTKNEIETDTNETGTDTLTRHGNIGVTTSQQMLQSELDLRKLDFIKMIFRDVDRVLFRNYYGRGEFWPL